MKKAYSRLWNISFLVIIGTFAFSSCEDFVEIDPPISELVSETVFANDENATAAIRGVYFDLMNSNFPTGPTSIPYLGGLCSDELDDFQANEDKLGFYRNNLIAENESVKSNWSLLYKIIYETNSILQAIENSTLITPELKKLLEGEAKFLRAFCYFYLINFFGDVPMITHTDFEKNRLAPRSPVSDIYGLIVNDLKEAHALLPEDYEHAGGEKVRVNKGTAAALLSRTYLYLEDWENAEQQATVVLNNPNYKLNDDLNNVFLKNSTEVIWQLKAFSRGNTQDGNIFILTNTPSFAALSSHMVNAFEIEDQRKTNWVGTFTNEIGSWDFPFKYKVKSDPDPDNATEYPTVFRLAEQYLIRAEARTQQGNLAGAREDLNRIRNRAGLENTPANTQMELMDAILKERQVELFTEWAHRWLDLKRTNRSGEVLGTIKAGWDDTDVLWPIPQSERESNPNLTQNSGY